MRLDERQHPGLLRRAVPGRGGHHRRRSAHCGLPPGLPLAPSLSPGRRQVHPRDETARRPHPQQWVPDLPADGARRPLAEPAVPQPPGHVRRPAHRRFPAEDRQDERLPPRPDPAARDPRDRGDHQEVHRRGGAGPEGRLRRGGPQHGQHPHHDELHVAVVEPARPTSTGARRRNGPNSPSTSSAASRSAAATITPSWCASTASRPAIC